MTEKARIYLAGIKEQRQISDFLFLGQTFSCESLSATLATGPYEGGYEDKPLVMADGSADSLSEWIAEAMKKQGITEYSIRTDAVYTFLRGETIRLDYCHSYYNEAEDGSWIRLEFKEARREDVDKFRKSLESRLKEK